ncbi:MAG: glutaredoxin family protein [Beutenbergiaceae bacterium]
MAERVQLLGRDGCHLCDQARTVVRDECARAGASWSEIDVDSDPDLQRQYGELVPVVLVDGQQIGYWRIPAADLRAALR